jgi:uncharacterized membrane protein YhhN
MSLNLRSIFVVFVLLYMLGLYYSVGHLWLLKIFPIGILGIVVLQAAPSSIRTTLICALIFSGCGDLLLAFDLFIYGVGAFLLAQLSYAWIFKSYWQGLQQRWLLTALLSGYVVVMGSILLPNLGDLQLPVLAYLIVIATMGLLAAQSSLPIRWAVIGALLFIVSDSFIAINKFVTPLPMAGFLIMSTYYAAQLMLVNSLLARSHKPNIT